jgi:hypothetical protein
LFQVGTDDGDAGRLAAFQRGRRQVFDKCLRLARDKACEENNERKANGGKEARHADLVAS